MAALIDREIVGCFKKLCSLSHFSSAVRRHASVALVDEKPAVVRYPDIRPRYPPGSWGNMTESSAWYLHRMSEELAAEPRLKERLEKIAGQKNRLIWEVDAVDPRPKSLPFRQMLTKSHIAAGLPEVYNTVSDECNTMYEQYRPIVSAAVDLEFNHHYKMRLEENLDGVVFVDREKYSLRRLFESVLNSFSARLSASKDYIQRCQFDRDVRVETFWYVNGFRGEGVHARGKWSEIRTHDGKNAGILLFQYRHRADMQIRTEDILPEFMQRDASVCTTGFVPHVSYGPAAGGMHHVKDRPVTVSGHWSGDPCEFALLSLHIMPTVARQKFEQLGDQHLKEALLSFGMTAAFASCLAQAHNQGFTFLHDVTYPVTTQCIVTDGRSLQLIAYQLNTLRLWIDNDDGPDTQGNKLRNIIWASEPVPLFKGDSRVPNDDAFKLLLQCMLLKPTGRLNVNLRPYLAEEAPVKRHFFINHKGEEPSPTEKIERFQYPRNAVYF